MLLLSPCVSHLSVSTLVPIGSSNRWVRHCHSNQGAGDSSTQFHCVSKKHFVRSERRVWWEHLSGHGILWGQSASVTSQRWLLNWSWNKNCVLQGQEAERCCCLTPRGNSFLHIEQILGTEYPEEFATTFSASITSSPIAFLNYLEINMYKNCRFVDSHNKSQEVPTPLF